MRLVLAFAMLVMLYPALALAVPDTPATFAPVPDAGLWAVIIVTNALMVYGVRQIVRGLDVDSNWSMSLALSEIVDQGDPNTPSDPDGKPRIIKAPLPSTSRLIALLGMVVIMGVFLGIGDVLIWGLGKTGKVPDLENAKSFLYGGAALFAPYLFNQTKEAIKALGK